MSLETLVEKDGRGRVWSVQESSEHDSSEDDELGVGDEAHSTIVVT
jgi:hypothetical protein